jgi:hypothetical protein
MEKMSSETIVLLTPKSASMASEEGAIIEEAMGVMKVMRETRAVAAQRRLKDQFFGFVGSLGPSKVTRFGCFVDFRSSEEGAVGLGPGSTSVDGCAAGGGGGGGSGRRAGMGCSWGCSSSLSSFLRSLAEEVCRDIGVAMRSCCVLAFRYRCSIKSCFSHFALVTQSVVLNEYTSSPVVLRILAETKVRRIGGI